MRPSFRVLRLGLAAPLLLGAFSSCSKEGDAPSPPPAPTRPASACKADRAANAPGSGSFGCWITDPNGLPAYEWTLPEGDPRGDFVTKRDDPDLSNDHWHQVGNTRVRGMAHTDGRVRFTDGTRGTKWVSQWSESGVAIEGVDVPHEARRLVFGMGYAAETSDYADVQVTRTVFAPWGAGIDDPVLYVEYRLESRAADPRSVALRETWDAGMHPLNLELLYSIFPEQGDQRRDEFMAKFDQTAAWDAKHGAVTIDTDARADVVKPARMEAADGDYYPGTLALALLGGEPEGYAFEKRLECSGCTAATFATKGASTTHVGPPPFGVLPSAGKASAQAKADANAFVAQLGKTVTLAPGASTRVVFAVAYDDDEKIGKLLDRLRTAPPPTPAENAAEVAKVVPKVELPEGKAFDQALARELRWHGYYLVSSANLEEYYGVHNLDQQAAYGYLQGLRGTPRDVFITAVAAIHLRPDLAREAIRYLLMTATPEDAKMAYSTANFGQLTDASIHTNPSDLDFWLLWAIVEYVGATRDFALLEEQVPYWPPATGKKATVLERVSRALGRLTTTIGFGPHGMFRVGSGDWNDAIRFLAPSANVFATNGESSFDTAFGAYVFPRVADMVASRDAALAKQFSDLGTQLADVMRAQYNGKWFHRAWDGAGGAIGDDRIFLEHHGWLLVSDVPTADQRASVIREIDDRLSSKSPIGTWLVYPEVPQPVLLAGWDVNGGIWPAMNMLLVWGLSRTDPARAWREFADNSMAKHADVYPEVWYGIWSGPDSYNAAYARRPGEAPFHAGTPLTDFPVTNSNRHAMPLIDLVKLAGVDYDARGVTIRPRVPFAVFSFDTPLLALSYRADAVEGRFGFLSPGEVTLRLPTAITSPKVTVNGAIVASTTKGDSVVFTVPAGRATFRVAQ